MSVDKSLKVLSSLARTRSVLSRKERLVILKEEGRWTEDKSVFNLPKVRVRRAKRKAKKEEAAAAAPGAVAAPGAAPAAGAAAPAGAAGKPGAKPAAGAKPAGAAAKPEAKGGKK